MDHEPPDAKRPRLDTGSWQPPRSLPPAGPFHPAPPPPFARPERLDDRRLEHEYPHEPRAPPQFGSYNGPRESVVKRDPAEDAAIHRPRSTESHPPPTTAALPAPPYDGPPSTPIQPPPHMYRPPSTPFQAPSPMPPAPAYPYPPREPYYPPAVPLAASVNGRRKSQRASQACDSCRTLKAKCDELRPCSNCSEKGFPCNYRDPPPKQGDKVQAEMLSMMRGMMDQMQNMQKCIVDMQRELTHGKHVGLDRHPDAERLLKREPHENGVSPPQAFDEYGDYSPTTPIGEAEDEECGEQLQLGEPSFSVHHTTGAARLLLHPAIDAMVGDLVRSNKIKNEKYTITREEKRGLLRLFGRGEGLDLAPSFEDMSDDRRDTVSEASPSPAADTRWGMMGGLSPPARVEIKRENCGGLLEDGTLELDHATVTRLVGSYMKHMNEMHPILLPRHVDRLVRTFLKAPEPLRSHRLLNGLGPDSPATKRKRSPDPESKQGKPRSIGTALVLIMLALGKICEHRTKIPDVIHDAAPSAHGSPYLRSGRPPSPSDPSPPSVSPNSTGLPPESRRGSVDFSRPSPRNLDAIPGLAYFALATEIIGSQLAGNSLEHVHVNLLAGLYHGQLARVIESHTYIHQACRAMQVILRPKMERFKKLHDTGEPAPPKDNPILIAFWTCLQLESDILAELPCVQSNILTYESSMPYPNISEAEALGLEPRILASYLGQLFLRKHLNLLHNTFYGPSSDVNDRILHMVSSMEQTLNELEVIAPGLKFHEGDPPSDNILSARLRAKFYGAQVITYRPFVVNILENSMKGSFDVDEKHLEYAQKCIKALMNSTSAFHGLGEGRLIVTNVWGTAHAQWGNMLVLQAALRDPVLKPFVEPEIDKLRYLLNKTINFLQMVAQPSSALAVDIKILKHAGRFTGLLPPRQLNSSFSSNISSV